MVPIPTDKRPTAEIPQQINFDIDLNPISVSTIHALEQFIETLFKRDPTGTFHRMTRIDKSDYKLQLMAQCV